MKFRVWQMRAAGEKLPQDGLDGPHVGWLRLQRGNIAGELTLHASLHIGAGQGAPMSIQGLTAVEVRRLDERGLLLYGLQADAPAGPAAVRYQQAWYCQPINAALAEPS